MDIYNDFAAISGWSMDFVRAMRERSLFAKILFRIALGKYAYREFIGLIDMLITADFSPYFSYDLNNAPYHKEKIRFNWWKNP
jgi:hypothetical protein